MCEFCGEEEHASCDNCGAPATGRRCPSCEYFVCEIEAMHVGDAREAAGLPRLPSSSTDEFIERIRAVARDCGYAVGVHGSLRPERDLDLVAVPWTPEACSADQLVTRLCDELGLTDHPQPLFMASNPEPKAWGRWAWSLAGCPEHQYIDLSVAPRAGEPVPLLTAHTGATP